MKTINFKKAAQKNVTSLEQFEMTSTELQKIAGGIFITIRRDENGDVIIRKVSAI
jgi:hypothetical protein